MLLSEQNSATTKMETSIYKSERGADGSQARAVLSTASWGPCSFVDVQGLYAAGARRIVVANLGTIGCYPIVIAKGDPSATVCNEQVNKWARQYNAALAKALKKVRGKLPGATILEMDYYAIFENIQTRPAAFGTPVVPGATLSCPDSFL